MKDFELMQPQFLPRLQSRVSLQRFYEERQCELRHELLKVLRNQTRITVTWCP